MTPQQLSALVEIIGRFKDIKRTGWVRRGVSSPESDAEHSFSVAFLTMLIAPGHLDKLRCLQLALIHDLAEVYCGDILPLDLPEKYRGNPTAEEIRLGQNKLKLETASMQKISEELDRADLLELFEEYEKQSTPEAQFVKSMDKADNVFSAAYYDKHGRSPQPVFPEFSEQAQKKVKEIPPQEAQISKQIIEELINMNQQDKGINHD